MGDEQDRHLALQPVHRLAEALGSRPVKIASRLVEYQDARAFEDGARDGETLLLPARETDTVLAELSVIPLRQLLNEVVRGDRVIPLSVAVRNDGRAPRRGSPWASRAAGLGAAVRPEARAYERRSLPSRCW
jgi:hypothetical protein